MAKGQSLIFKDAAMARDAITKSQQKQISTMFESWADDIHKKSLKYEKKSNSSAPMSKMQMIQFEKQLRNTSKDINKKVEKGIVDSLYLVSDSVVKDNAKWLSKFGFDEKSTKMAFSFVPKNVVNNLITGQVYESGWSLSKSIWGDSENTLKSIYEVVAAGMAKNESAFEISKQVENFVRPSAKKDWNLKTKDGKRIYPKQVDYNSQRLVRSLAQHTYQQSFVGVTKDNPFVKDYIWRSNGSRACDLCRERDGKHYVKSDLPLDHPNGMCIMEPNVSDSMNDDLVNWFNSPDGTYPEIDKFAKNFDGKPKKKLDASVSFINKYGMSSKSFNAWYGSLSQTQKMEAKYLKKQSGLTWNQWFDKYVSDTGDASLNFVKKYGKSTKTSGTAWFDNLPADIKVEAKLAKDSTGLTWNQWFDKYMFKGAEKSIDATDDLISAAKNKFNLAKKNLNKFSNKVYSGIWKDDVTPADYLEKKTKIKAKRKYYEDNIRKYSSDAYSNSPWAPNEIVRMKKLLDELDDFEKQGKLYEKAKDDFDKAKKSYYKIVGKPEKFSSDMYTKEAYNVAHKFTSGEEADKFHRLYLDSIWDDETEYEKYSIWEYTRNSNPVNKSLSGYHDTWARGDFLGVGKTDLGHEDNWRAIPNEFSKYGKDGHCDYKSVVQNLTTAIEKSEMPESIFLVRGSDMSGFAGLLEGDLFSFDDAKSLLESGDQILIKKALEGQTFTSHSFTSTGVSEGTGFRGTVNYEIYCPAGTKGIYAEPTSYFGNTISGANLYKKGQDYHGISREAEMILQRGTQYRITEVKSVRYDIYVKMEVVDQPDYFKTGLEQTIDGGKTVYKK